MNFRDVELLSAYLDGQLSRSDSARLEARLKSDEALRAGMDDLRLSRSLLRSLPSRRAPRSFALTPKMAGIKPPEPRAYPAFRLATVLAALFFVASVALNSLVHVASSNVALQAAPAAPQSFAAALPTETLTAEKDKSLALTAPAAELAPGSIPPAGGAAPRNALPINPPSLNSAEKEGPAAPVPLAWQIGLAALALVFGFMAGLVRLTSERNFRRQFHPETDSKLHKNKPKN